MTYPMTRSWFTQVWSFMDVEVYHGDGEIDTFLDCGDGSRDPCLAA